MFEHNYLAILMTHYQLGSCITREHSVITVLFSSELGAILYCYEM